MRVLHIADSFEGGGAESVFRSTISASEANRDTIRVLTGETVRNPLAYIFSARNARLVLREIESFDPDLIHIQNFYHKLSPSVLWAIRCYRRKSKKSTPKVIFTAHDYHLVAPNSGFQYFSRGNRHDVSVDEKPVKLLRRWDSRSWPHALLKLSQYFFNYRILNLTGEIDKVIAPSHFLSDVIKRHVPSASVTVVRNPVDSSFDIDQQRIKPSVRDDGSIRLCFIGRISAEKGVAEFLGVLSETGITNSIEFHIIGAGEGAELDRIDSAARQAGIRVISHGKLCPKDTADRLASMDIMVLPSLWLENAPLVLIEAALLGIPTLTVGRGGMLELSELSEASRAVDISNSGEVEKAILELALCKGKNWPKDAGRFSFTHFTMALKDVYELVLEGEAQN